jgi:hydroxylaminobenzene mutase
VSADVLVGIGLVSISVGAVSGFALAAAVEKPGSLRRLGVVDPHRLRQVHLDWIIMGVLLVAVGMAVPSLAWYVVVPIGFGGIVNPLSFLPMAFSKTVHEAAWFRGGSYLSFVALSGGLVAATCLYLAA